MVWVDYQDIVTRIAEEPKWWISGMPRYCEFEPSATTVYGHEVALIRAECQSCGQKFLVAIVNPDREGGLSGAERLALSAEFGVGDTPHIGCCRSGPLMGALELELLQFWELEAGDWVRRNALEGPLHGDFDNPSRRLSAYDYATRSEAIEEFQRLIELESELALTALLTRAGHPMANIAARAAITFQKHRITLKQPTPLT